MQIKAAMRHVPMHIERHRHESELHHHHERCEDISPEIQLEDAVQHVEVHWAAVARSLRKGGLGSCGIYSFRDRVDALARW